MVSPLSYTLVSDGTTDRALLPIITWLLLSLEEVRDREIRSQCADLRGVPRERGLAGRIGAALRLYPCDLFFVHRDAESAERAVVQQRHVEIHTAMAPHSITWVGVVPIRMTEAWLLLEADAIRQAADNPHSRARLELPALRRLETISDPKHLLHDLLLQASEKTGRRLAQFRSELSWRRVRVAELIRDFSPLARLSAFAAFSQETRRVVTELPRSEE
jgi:hypothetical protein